MLMCAFVRKREGKREQRGRSTGKVDKNKMADGLGGGGVHPFQEYDSVR